MHTYQLIAVSASNEEDALTIIDCVLHDEYSPFDWADWWSIGGRWSNQFGEVISYETDPDAFTKALETAKKDRAQNVAESLERIYDLDGGISELRNFDGDTTTSMDLFFLDQAIAIVRGHGKCDSHFYDLEEKTESFRNIPIRIDEQPNKQYLVVVDFHY